MSVRFNGIEPLTAGHHVAGFDCGSVAQSNWLVNHGLHAHRSGTSRVYVATDGDGGRVVGYYALCAGSVAPALAPHRPATGAGRYHQPVVIITRLGVDLSAQGHGLGRRLVRDALRRVAGAADVIGIRAILIHCESESARDFYMSLAKFDESPTDPMHLFLLLKDLRKAIDAS